MEMDLLHTFNTSHLLRGMSVKPKLVNLYLYVEFNEYQKSPEKKPKEEEVVPHVPVDLGREWNSRLRLYIWLQLRKLYDAFVLGRKLTPNDENLRGLIKSILGDISEMEITFLLNGLFKLDKTIEFGRFVIII